MCYEEIKKLFSQLSSTTSFLVGFLGAILVLCAIGFFIFAGLMLKGNLSYKNTLADTSARKVSIEDTAPLTDLPADNQPSNNDLTETAGAVKPLSSRDHVSGENKAPLILIVYSDFECPFCKKFHATLKQLEVDYKGKIKWAYRHYPLSFHANAEKEAEATECAYELGGHKKFWEFADKIYERTVSNGTGFALADLPKLAAELGLNKKSFEDCLNNNKYKDFVAQSLTEGTAAGVQGTPGTIIFTLKGEKKLIKGALPIELMKPIIDQALEK